jgi:hypothetical protein
MNPMTDRTDEQRATQRRLVAFTTGAPWRVAPDVAVWWPRPIEGDVAGSLLAELGGPGPSTAAVIGWLSALGVPSEVAQLDAEDWPVLSSPSGRYVEHPAVLDGWAVDLRKLGHRLAPLVEAEHWPALARWAPRFVERVRASAAAAGRQRDARYELE